MPLVSHWIARLRAHRYGLTLFIFLAAAVLTGAACVLFARTFDYIVERRFDQTSLGAWVWIVTPLGFLLAVWMVRRLAPYAAGTGIPQAIFAAEHLTPATEEKLWPLVSMRTMLVKVTTLLLAVGVGASTGREGPTVHIAVCLFVGIIVLFRRWTGLPVDLRSAVIAGGAAGLAAAFNTPLAGVTFAIEELSENYFGSVKDIVLMAIIVAAAMAKTFTGEYSYFGHLREPIPIPLMASAAIGVVCGLAGASFSTLLLKGSELLSRYSERYRVGVPLVMSAALVATAACVGTGVLGPGQHVAQKLLLGDNAAAGWVFPFAKMASTLFTYWSGVAGGIFAPCLSIGAAIGSDLGAMAHLPLATCALLGMAAFLSGTIQAPMTAFVIIFEMSGHHQMLVPIMLTSLLAFMAARLAGARHFYQALAGGYQLAGATPKHERPAP